LPAQGDVHRRHDLLDGAHAVDAIDAKIARPIGQVAYRIIDGRITFQNLLIGSGVDKRVAVEVGLRHAAPGIDHRFDRGPVKRQERLQPAAPIAAHIERRRVGHENLFEEHAQPIGKAMDAVRPGEKVFHRRDTRRVRSGTRPTIPRGDVPGLTRGLILSRLDDKTQKIVTIGERAQRRKGNRLEGTRECRKIIAGRIIPLPPGDLGGRERRDWR
jgi:hypothetical protein